MMQMTASDNNATGSAAIATSDSANAEKPIGVARRILLAEDGLFNQMLVSTILHQHGLVVEVVGNGALAVARTMEALHTGTVFDLILMDIQMPVMNGDVATAKLRAMGYPGVIVAVTADDTDAGRAHCLDAGCNSYLTKPVNRDALISVIETYLSNGEYTSAQQTTIPADDSAQQAGAPLYSSYANDPDMVMLVEDFVDQLPGHVAAIRTAANSDDLGGVTRLAHQLNGAAGGYGFMPVSHAAAALEKAARAANSIGSLMPALEGLAQVCAQVRK